MTKERFRRKPIVFLVLCLALLAPATASAAGLGDIIQFLQAIENTLHGTIAPVLSEIQRVNTALRDLQQKVVWPLSLINQTKAFIGQVHIQLGGVAGQVYAISNASATLTNPSQFENLLRSGQSGKLNQIGGAYTKVFQALPSSSDAAATERNLMDVDDATAQEAFKTAVISDQASQQMLSVADGIERQASTTAAGVAPLLSAQAEAANLQSQAFLQKLLAAALRQDVAHVAHANALRKRNAQALRGLSNQIQQILTRH